MVLASLLCSQGHLLPANVSLHQVNPYALGDTCLSIPRDSTGKGGGIMSLHEGQQISSWE